MTKLHELANLGQAIWLDYIRRSFITSGELQALIDQGVRGLTSNPSIFEKAIAGSADYDADLRSLVEAGKSVGEIYESLVLDDIRRVADILRPVYDQTGGADGYVSLEVSPTLAHDTDGTIAEARRLFAALDCPNVMIKVPATPAGIPAIETLIGEGINVNVTLIFSLAQYEAVAEAYLAGLEKLAAGGGYGNPPYGDVSTVASVASFFVSRVESAVDRQLDELIHSGQHTPESLIPNPQSLKGKIATANGKVAYARFREIFHGARACSALCGPAPAPRTRSIPIRSTWTVSSGLTRSTPCRPLPSRRSSTTAPRPSLWRRAWTRPAPSWPAWPNWAWTWTGSLRGYKMVGWLPSPSPSRH